MTSGKTDKIKIMSYVTKETDEKIEKLMEVTGMTKGRLASLAIQAGIAAIGMAFDPNWSEYFEKVDKTWKWEDIINDEKK